MKTKGSTDVNREKTKYEKLKDFKNKNGITLIALVVTIIVLLILSGISIKAISGEDGILKQAIRAKEQNRYNDVKEMIDLWIIKEEDNDDPKSEQELLNELLESKKVDEKEINRSEKTITISGKEIYYGKGSALTNIFVALYDDGTLVFSNTEDKIDFTKISNNSNYYGNIRGKKYYIHYTENGDESVMPPWNEDTNKILNVQFLTKIVPVGTAFWFSRCFELNSIDLNNLDTSNVTDMGFMFANCSKLTSLDVSKFNTSNVTYMSYMFSDCSQLTNLDVRKFNTSNVTDMSGMFLGCSKLINLDLNNFDTSNVITMRDMFMNCSGLTSLDFSNFDTSNVEDMYRMFIHCKSLTALDLSSFDTSKVKDMDMMFCDCTGLEELNVSSFNTEKVGGMMQMFDGCKKLNSLDLSSFNTNNVGSCSAMFNGVILPKIYVGENWNMETTSKSKTYYKGIFEIKK